MNTSAQVWPILDGDTSVDILEYRTKAILDRTPNDAFILFTMFLLFVLLFSLFSVLFSLFVVLFSLFSMLFSLFVVLF